MKDIGDDFSFFLFFFSTLLFKGGGKYQELLLQKVFSIILFGVIKNMIYVGRTFWQNWWQLFLCPEVTICTFLWCSLHLTHPHPLLYSLLGAFLKSIVTKCLLGLWFRLLEFSSQLCQLLILCPWTNYLTSPFLHLLNIWNKDNNGIHLLGSLWGLRVSTCKAFNIVLGHLKSLFRISHYD